MTNEITPCGEIWELISDYTQYSTCPTHYLEAFSVRKPYLVGTIFQPSPYPPPSKCLVACPSKRDGKDTHSSQATIIDKTVGTMVLFEAPPSPISMLWGEKGKHDPHSSRRSQGDPKCQINIERGEGGCWIFFLNLNVKQGVVRCAFQLLLSLIVETMPAELKSQSGHGYQCHFGKWYGWWVTWSVERFWH